MRVIARINDPRYVNGRSLDVTDWPVSDLDRLRMVWGNDLEIVFLNS